ncbi:ADP-ribosylglycohydrolase family protein [Propionibacteriaceae bacterium G1746]
MSLNPATDLRQRARGALLGLAVGDAMGAPAENLDAAEIRQRFGVITGFLTPNPRGTDDTEYAAFVGRHILQHGLNLTAESLLDAYEAQILHLDRLRGAGFSELGTVMNLRRGWSPPVSGHHLHPWSDGVAMRAAVHGVAAAGDLQRAERLVRTDAAVCAAGEGVEAGVLVAVAVAAALAGGDLADALAAGVGRVEPSCWTRATVDFALTRPSADGVLERVVNPRYPWTDLAPEAVSIGVWAALVHGGEPALAIPGAIQLGRDADTTAALAGALCGAVAGEQAIPAEWRRQIGPLEGRCLPSVAGVDIAELAEELAAMGARHRTGHGGGGHDVGPGN